MAGHAPRVWEPGMLAVHAILGGAVWSGLGWLGATRSAWWLVLFAVGAGAVHAYVALRRPLRRAAALRAPFPDAWKQVLEARVRFYRRLDTDGRRRFQRNLQLVLADYALEPVGDVAITDEVRVLAGAGAAMILHGLEDVRLPGRRTILVYPDHFDDDYATRQDGHIAGMVHRQGPIVFSARALKRGFAADDGYNVSLHEFAHVLDLDDGWADGAPAILTGGTVGRWSTLVARELADVRAGRSVLRSYAGTNEAELFAVAIEVFFEKPKVLKRRDPELYAALASALNQDPAADDATRPAA